MKLNYARKYRRILHKTEGIFYKNPVLACGLALPLAVVPTTSLNSAVALIVAMFIVYLPTLLLASLIGERLPRWLRTAVYPLVAAVLLLPSRLAVRSFSPTIFDTLGVYFSLICVSTLIIYGVERVIVMKKPGDAFRFGLWNWVGFSLVILLVSFFRELIGGGTLWGFPMKFIKAPMPGLLVAFFGFILLGFLAALAKLVHRGLNFFLLRAALPHEERAEGPRFFHFSKAALPAPAYRPEEADGKEATSKVLQKGR